MKLGLVIVGLVTLGKLLSLAQAVPIVKEGWRFNPFTSNITRAYSYPPPPVWRRDVVLTNANANTNTSSPVSAPVPTEEQKGTNRPVQLK